MPGLTSDGRAVYAARVKPEGKEPYEKPEIVVIALEAEQVLGVGCKTPVGPLYPGLPQCGIGAGCNIPGS